MNFDYHPIFFELAQVGPKTNAGTGAATFITGENKLHVTL